jgi:WD40-like Beta Propeller Repeat
MRALLVLPIALVAFCAPVAGGAGRSGSAGQIVFRSNRDDSKPDLYLMNRDGSGVHRLTYLETAMRTPAWSRDGTRIAFAASVNGTPLVEDFGDGYRDGSLWHSISDPGGSILETGGRLVATIEADAVPGGQFDQVDEHWGSQCTLTGDYDFQVDYQLLDWPAFGGMFTALSAFFGNAGISRLSNSSSVPFNQQYTSWNDGGFAALNTTDTAGSFRLARVGGYVTAYYRTAGSAAWQALFSGPAPNPTVYGMGLTAPGSTFQHVLGRVALDDFRLNSGALSCPDWWSEASPTGVARGRQTAARALHGALAATAARSPRSRRAQRTGGPPPPRSSARAGGRRRDGRRPRSSRQSRRSRPGRRSS